MSQDSELSPHLAVHRLSGALGAVVDASGIDDISTLDVAAALRRLVTEHHVVVVPGRDLSEDSFTCLARRFGELSIHPLKQLLGRPHPVSVIEDSAERPPAGFPWHTDLSWLPHPPRFGFLQALDIPPAGGDTLWVSLAALYEALSPALRQLCASLSAVHRIDTSLLGTVTANQGPEMAARLQAAHPPVTHPLVRAHPDTGAPCLFVSPMYVDHVEALRPAESALLLDHIDSLIADPQMAVRWRWTAGDVVIWDEAATVHKALTDHHPQRRRMRRCTTAGEQPQWWQPPAGARSPRDDVPVADDELPRIGAPATRALASIGVTRLAQVAECSASELLALHGVGPRAVRILAEVLALQGLSMRP